MANPHQNSFASGFNKVVGIVRPQQVIKLQVAVRRNKVGLVFFHLLQQSNGLLLVAGVEKDGALVRQDGLGRRFQRLSALDFRQRLGVTAEAR